MEKHSETNKLNHDLQVLSAVRKLQQKNDEGEIELKVKDSELSKLKEENIIKDKELIEIKNNVKVLENQVQQLSKKIENSESSIKNEFENIQEQLSKKIENFEQRTIDTLSEKIENHQSEQFKTKDQFNKEISNLKIFADRVSKLHTILSDRCLQLNRHHVHTLLKEKYDNNNEVTLWNNVIDEANKDDNKCNYLTKLTKSINQYKQTIYPSTYKERFENLVWSLPEGVIFNSFIRIKCYDKSLCVKTFHTFDEFTKEVEKKDSSRLSKVQNSPAIFSYHTADCLHVLLRGFKNYHLYLLHNANSDGKQLIPRSKEGYTIKDVSNFVFNQSIVIYYER